ncbi:MAG: hypothetical protein GC205_06120 [Bacteroidetes bacterium]|nr:hypothetical protein [Bacteroidota bacterium]
MSDKRTYHPIGILQRLSKHLEEQNWFAVGLEILIVVISIFLGFQVTASYESRKNLRTEAVYLDELREDFQANRALEDKTLGRLESILPQLRGLMEQSALAEPTWSVAELNTAFSNLWQMPTFYSTDRAYDNILGSGELKLIRDRKLKKEISEYYSSLELLQIVQNTHELELVQILMPYAVAQLDFQAVHLTRSDDYPVPAPVEPDRILEVLHTREFRGVLTTKWDILTDLLDLNRSLSKEIDEVLLQLP